MAGPSEQGERVETLGEKSLSVGPGFATETFVKVAPPAGEFRWIHAEQADANGNWRACRADRHPVPQSQPTVRSVGGPAAVAAAHDPETRSSHGPCSPSSPAADVAAKIEDLQVELSLLVAQPIDQWDLASLRKRVETLSQQNISDSLRRDVEAISRRIAEFQTLHSGTRNRSSDSRTKIGKSTSTGSRSRHNCCLPTPPQAVRAARSGRDASIR